MEPHGATSCLLTSVFLDISKCLVLIVTLGAVPTWSHIQLVQLQNPMSEGVRPVFSSLSGHQSLKTGTTMASSQAGWPQSASGGCSVEHTGMR